LENTEGAIKHGQSRETGNIGYTRRRGNKTWTIQRNWQHRVHKTKKNKTKTQRNWQHRVHKTKKNKTKTQRNWQHRVHKTKKNKAKTQRNWQHRVHKTKKNKAKTQRNWQHRVHKTKKNKAKTQHNICWTPLITNNVNNKTCALLQKTGGKEEPNITNLEIQFNQGNLEQLSYYVYFNQPDLI
jgi:hypothetical protein